MRLESGFAGMNAHFLSALFAPLTSRGDSPLCFLSEFASLGKLGGWTGVGSVFCDRILFTAGEVFVLCRICCAGESKSAVATGGDSS
jgi:hypothetical protein